MLAIFTALVVSCSNDEVQFNDEKEKEFTFLIDEFPKTIEFNGKKIEFEMEDTTGVELKASGPTQYTYLNMFQMTNSQKLWIGRNCSPYQGTYLASIFTFDKEFTFPAGSEYAKVIIPTGFNKAFNNPYSQEYGINGNIKYSPNKPDVFVINFYTLRIEYDMGGRRIGAVYPMDGRNLQVGYYFIY